MKAEVKVILMFLATGLMFYDKNPEGWQYLIRNVLWTNNKMSRFS